MTDPHMPFLAAIIARPDDDLPRLIYADWLDENGDGERAEVIRVQCELARHECPKREMSHRGLLRKRCEKCDALRRRERALWHTLATERLFTPPGFTLREIFPFGTEFSLDPAAFCIVRRGFVEEVSMDWSECRERLAAIRKWMPVRKVRLTTRPDDGLYEPFAAQFPSIEFELPTAGRLFEALVRVRETDR